MKAFVRHTADSHTFPTPPFHLPLLFPLPSSSPPLVRHRSPPSPEMKGGPNNASE